MSKFTNAITWIAVSPFQLRSNHNKQFLKWYKHVNIQHSSMDFTKVLIYICVWIIIKRCKNSIFFRMVNHLNHYTDHNKDSSPYMFKGFSNSAFYTGIIWLLCDFWIVAIESSVFLIASERKKAKHGLALGTCRCQNTFMPAETNTLMYSDSFTGFEEQLHVLG